jgi:hypothetical protein
MPVQLVHEGRLVAPSARARTDSYQKDRSELERLLACPVGAEAMQSLFLSKMLYFFVRGDFAWLSSNIDNVCRSVRGANLSPSMTPSKPDLTALSKHGALSLPAILRLHRASKQLQLTPNRKTNRVAFIMKGSIIPSIRYVDPEIIARLRKDSKKSERELILIMNHYLETLLDVDRAEHNPIPMYFFSERLEQGEALPSRGKKYYRITTACAMAICHVFTGTTDRTELKVECDMLFPENHTLGSGNGMYTVALPRNYGNQLYYY